MTIKHAIERFGIAGLRTAPLFQCQSDVCEGTGIVLLRGSAGHADRGGNLDHWAFLEHTQHENVAASLKQLHERTMKPLNRLTSLEGAQRRDRATGVKAMVQFDVQFLSPHRISPDFVAQRAGGRYKQTIFRLFHAERIGQRAHAQEDILDKVGDVLRIAYPALEEAGEGAGLEPD